MELFCLIQISPLVSAVITTYNRDFRFLMEAINSIQNQTYDHIELIVVDDNGIGTEIQKQNSEALQAVDYVKYAANEHNSGAQYSRNKGIELAHGEYIAFLDDDDIWLPTKIEKQVARIQETQAGMVYCNGYIVFENETDNREKIYNKHNLNTPVTFKRELENDYIGTTSQVLIKRECFNKVGYFDLQMPARQDYEMWIRISKEYPIAAVDECLFCHRMHKGEQISKNPEKVVSAYLLIYKKNREDYLKDPQASASLFYTIFRIYRKSGRVMKAIRYLIKAILLDPFSVAKKIISKIKKDSL